MASAAPDFLATSRTFLAGFLGADLEPWTRAEAVGCVLALSAPKAPERAWCDQGRRTGGVHEKLKTKAPLSIWDLVSARIP